MGLMLFLYVEHNIKPEMISPWALSDGRNDVPHLSTPMQIRAAERFSLLFHIVVAGHTGSSRAVAGHPALFSMGPNR
jgi:hypothetical protein